MRQSEAVMILKPDILTGPYSRCSRAVARDAIRGVLTVYSADTPTIFEAETSENAVRWALHNIFRKAKARPWYNTELCNSSEHIRLLTLLTRSPQFFGDESVEMTVLVHALVSALGFNVKRRHLCTFTYRDFLGLYADNTHFSRLAGDLRGYLLGQPVDIYLLEGPQEHASLHIVKEMIRRVVRYPTTHYDALENLLHVSDPDSRDWLYFKEVVGRD